MNVFTIDRRVPPGATRVALMAAVMVAVAAPAANAAESTYPTRAITVVVPQAPGGANDTVARVVLAQMSQNLGHPIVIENRVGAGGNIGTQGVARAPRDGYTLLLTVGSTHTINPSLYKNPGFDPIRDFEPVSLVGTAPYVLVVNPAVPAQNTAELLAWIKSRPETLNYASAGNGTLNHLFAEMFKTATGVNMVHVPYKSAAASVTDVVSGQLPLTFASLPAATPFVKSGKLRILGVASPQRSALLPDVPPVGDTVRGFGAVSWYGLLAPAGTPNEVVAKLAAEVARAVTSASVRERMMASGGEPTSSTPAEFAALIRDELPRWAAIVKTSGARID